MIKLIMTRLDEDVMKWVVVKRGEGGGVWWYNIKNLLLIKLGYETQTILR